MGTAPPPLEDKRNSEKDILKQDTYTSASISVEKVYEKLK